MVDKTMACDNCALKREDCWFWSEDDVGIIPRPIFGECMFRGVMIESAGVILAMGGRRIDQWEARGGRLRGIGRGWSGGGGRGQ